MFYLNLNQINGGISAHHSTRTVRARPTLTEAGYPSLEVYTWYAMFGPAGLPADVLAKVNGEVNAILALAEVRSLLEKQGLVPVGPPSRLADLLELELGRWARVVANAGISAE